MFNINIGAYLKKNFNNSEAFENYGKYNYIDQFICESVFVFISESLGHTKVATHSYYLKTL